MFVNMRQLPVFNICLVCPTLSRGQNQGWIIIWLRTHLFLRLHTHLHDTKHKAINVYLAKLPLHMAALPGATWSALMLNAPAHNILLSIVIRVWCWFGLTKWQGQVARFTIGREEMLSSVMHIPTSMKLIAQGSLLVFISLLVSFFFLWGVNQYII